MNKETDRKKAGKAIILVLLIVILVGLTKALGIFGFFLGLVLIGLVCKMITESDHETATH